MAFRAGPVRPEILAGAEIAFGAAGLLCVLISTGIFGSQLTLMFFDKSIDATLPALATYAATLLAPVLARPLGVRLSLAVTAGTLGLATATTALVRSEWVELIAAGVGVVVGAWWLSLYVGSRSSQRGSGPGIPMAIGIAAYFVLRAASRTVPIDGIPLPAAGIIVLGLMLGLGIAGRMALAAPRRWVTTDARGALGLLALPPLIFLSDVMTLNGAAIAGAGGLALGPAGVASTYVGALFAGAGIGCALALRIPAGARPFAAAAAVALGTGLVVAHLGPVSVVGGVPVAFGTVLGASVLVDSRAREARSPVLVASMLGLGWLIGIVGTEIYYLRFASEQVLVGMVALVVAALALAPSSPDLVRLRPAASYALAALAVVVPVATLATTPSPIVASHPGSFRIMAYNIHLGYDNVDVVAVDAIADAIRVESPDLVALTEVPRGVPIMGGHDLIGQLAERLRMSFAFGPMVGDVYGLAILSRVPIDEIHVERLARTDTSDIPRVALFVKTAGLTLVATHLGGDIPSEVRSIIDAVGPTRGVIVAGDLNSTPDSPQMQLFAAAGFTDLGAVANANTFPPDRPYKRIDYLWGAGVTALTVRTIDTLASDHLPVVADVTVP